MQRVAKATAGAIDEEIEVMFILTTLVRWCGRNAVCGGVKLLRIFPMDRAVRLDCNARLALESDAQSQLTRDFNIDVMVFEKVCLPEISCTGPPIGIRDQHLAAVLV